MRFTYSCSTDQHVSKLASGSIYGYTITNSICIEWVMFWQVEKLRISPSSISTQISTLEKNIKDTALARVVAQSQTWFTQCTT